MELLLQPEVKTKYEKCKYTVKYWEHHFKIKHGRLPSKLDIKEASNEIRYAYKTYFNLKSAALEQSFQDIDGFNSDDDNQENSNTSNVANIETSANSDTNIDNIDNIDSTYVSDKLDELGDNVNTEKTWGTHLNNVTNVHTEEATSKVNANSSFTQKLFKNANPMKRNLRKSISFHHRKSESSLVNESSFSLSQPAGISAIGRQNSEEMLAAFDNDLQPDKTEQNDILNVDNVRFTTVMEPVTFKSVNVVQSVLDAKFTTRNVDAGWMKRVAVSAGTKMTNKCLKEDNNFALSKQIAETHAVLNNYDSDEDIIDDSDEEGDAKLHFNKKRKLNDGKSTVNVAVPIPNNLLTPPISQENTNNFTSINSSNVTNSESIANLKESTEDHHNNAQKEPKENVEVENIPKKPVKSKARKPSVKKTMKKTTEENTTVRKSTRTRNNRVNLKETDIDEGEEDPFANEEEADPDFTVDPQTEKESVYDFDEPPEEDAPVDKPKKSAGKSKKGATASKSKPRKKKDETEKSPEAQEVDPTYELEFSVKPRRVTVPRDANFKEVLKKSKPQKTTTKAKVSDADGKEVKAAQQVKREQFEKKVASGNLNDNYVRINIEKKVFVRGKKNMNFSRYKKKMWRQKKKNNDLCGPDMDMGGCDGGQLTCFKCGQVGHFAQRCPAQKGDGLLPLAAGTEEDCPYPTLEEASEMAKSSQLAIRKSRTADKAKPEESIEEESTKEIEKVIDEKVVTTEDGDDTESESEEDNDVIPDKNWFDDDEDDNLLAETLKIEEYVKKLDEEHKQLVDDSRVIKPYYPLENGELMPTPQEVYDVLEMFGHSKFRAGQEKAIMRILSGQSTLVTLSTGSGKSLCYQIPAYLFAKREPCIALVISPLVSLMEDQVTGLPHFLKAECLHTNKTKVQRERILDTIATGDLHVLLVSPEAVVAGEKQTGFGSLLRRLPPVAFACIDEAHCVSQWSHNFRPSYLMICSILKERLGIKTILGLTATATRATSDSIISHISVPDGRNGIISDVPVPDNLRLTVSKDANRDQALLNLLLSDRFASLRSIIVYCTRRQECERIAAFLRTTLKEEKLQEQAPENEKKGTGRKRKKMHVQAEPYHAGLAASRRRTIQNSFMRGDLRIVVATVAFGMGINKSDIRAVIHYNLPKNFESYTQEVGRAGRDGLPAHCHLFLDNQGRDENELQRHIFSDSIDRHVIRKLLEKIFVGCTCKGKCPKHEVAFSIEATVRALDIPEENISTLLCYLELHDEKYIEVLSPAYTACKITAYGTAIHIRKAAADCPPLAMALAMHAPSTGAMDNIFEFPIVEVASAMGWDSGVCKFKLKNLEWITVNNQPKRSTLTVQFVNLGFRLLAPGNLTGEQLDEALDTLHARVQSQEKCALLQLRALHETVTSVAEASYRRCISDSEVSEKGAQLKTHIRAYFDSAQPLAACELRAKQCDEGRVAHDARVMIGMYRDNNFTGRALARIFYGIPSPNYPAVVWGRCRYWRAHIDSDFHEIVRIATGVILKSR